MSLKHLQDFRPAPVGASRLRRPYAKAETLYCTRGLLMGDPSWWVGLAWDASIIVYGPNCHLYFVYIFLFR